MEPEKISEGRVVAFIDIGTNSVRLLLVRINPNGSYQPLTKQKETVRLGEKEFIDRILQPQAMERAAVVCKKFVELARAYGAEEVIAVATSATRDASNKVQFLEMLKKEAYLEVCPISGIEEARLIYLGVSSGLRLGYSKALFIDIGGGSTEVSIGDQNQHYFLHSFNLGAIRLTNMFLPDETGPVSEERYEQIKAYIRRKSANIIKELSRYRIGCAVGSSGTIENLAKIAFVYLRKAGHESFEKLEYEDLKKIVRAMCALPLEERRKFPGINAQRADIILAGSAIIETLMEELELPEITVSKRGLREGLLVDYISKSEFSYMVTQMSVRKRSIMQLGLACNFDEEHAHIVTRLALELFDSIQALGVHEFKESERELLEYGATLHDIGTFLSYDTHQAHAYHLIRESSLPGFQPEEIEIIANLAYFHRKNTPKKKHPNLEGLSKEAVKSVRLLSALLRIAEGLDRSHTGIISHVRFYIASTDSLVLEMHAREECQLEIWEVEKQKKYFKKMFGYNLQSKVLIEQAAGAPLIFEGSAEVEKVPRE
ncbi:TPA: Ppx/GppA family phosphatase [Methanosarcina acetivorans]|uniref:Exopolyphosphatase n=2 Tax=Methanosarcina acetivorans TaxID=2214 RepID=Q8TUI4_METAC|nr:Ppx/GppA phosphatase family protein [Methanosarcina acetivorans]AAM03537.1 exopolyphosphatase [Methanosarcina acetivorans C2A]HIH93214.1 Ppx/GppA family phosphatase [Methanosarcina acetivorans]